MRFPNIGHETKPFTSDGADQPLRSAAVADRLSGRGNPAVKRRLRNDAAVPHLGNQVVSADHAGAVANKE